MNYYELLGVSKNASEKEIKREYKKAMREFHPDNVAASGISEEEATEKSQLLNEAARILLDKETRKKYDASLSEVSTSRGSKGG